MYPFPPHNHGVVPKLAKWKLEFHYKFQINLDQTSVKSLPYNLSQNGIVEEGRLYFSHCFRAHEKKCNPINT
jgi:hypothetical protein